MLDCWLPCFDECQRTRVGGEFEITNHVCQPAIESLRRLLKGNAVDSNRGCLRSPNERMEMDKGEDGEVLC